MGDEAITVRGLRKSYGDVHAVRGIDLTVEPGGVEPGGVVPAPEPAHA